MRTRTPRPLKPAVRLQFHKKPERRNHLLANLTAVRARPSELGLRMVRTKAVIHRKLSRFFATDVALHFR